MVYEGTGRTVVVAGSFHEVESSPVGPFQAFVSIQKGMVDAASIILFYFLVYASFFVVLETKALHAFIGWLLRLLKGKELIMIPVVMFVFAVAATTFGMYEESYGFIPLFVGLGIAWTMRYALKIKKDPTKSLMYGVDMGCLALDHDELIGMPFSGRGKVILTIVCATVAALVWGVMKQGWYLDEIVGLFLIMGIVSALVAGWGADKIAVTYLEGCREIVFGAMVIGLSRGVLVVLNDGKIIDTVIYGLAQPLAHFPSWVAAEGMLFVQTLINFLIPSGSGQAATTMPIMAPLSDLLGVTRQTAVLAYQFGDGFSNLIWPTASVPIICAIAKVPMAKWWKYYVPFFLLILPVQMLFIAAAVALNLQ